MKNIFGLTSTSIAIKTDLNMDKIKEAAFGIAKEREFSTFRVTAQRLQKLVAPSMEIEREVGSFINEKLSKKVSLKKFDLEIGVEISDFAYVFTEKTACFGGLPVGIEGKVLAFIEDDASILAAWLMMKRGCSIVPAAIKTGDISLLRRYGCYEQVSLVKGFKELAELASEKKCKALVVNQTLETFKGIDTEMAILRPLIALTGEEIKEQLEKISAGQTQK